MCEKPIFILTSFLCMIQGEYLINHRAVSGRGGEGGTHTHKKHQLKDRSGDENLDI